MPRTTFDSLRDPQVVHHFALEVQGIEEATFMEASGFENSHEVVEQREVGKGGKQYINKQPGQPEVDRHRAQARCDGLDGAVYVAPAGHRRRRWIRRARTARSCFYDARNQEISRVNFRRGWPSKWKSSDVKTSDNAALVEEITIAHEGLTRSS